MADPKEDTDLIVAATALQTREPLPQVDVETNWKRAFVVLVLILASEFTTRDQLVRWVLAVRRAAGNEPADFMARYFKASRSSFMDSFMG